MSSLVFLPAALCWCRAKNSNNNNNNLPHLSQVIEVNQWRIHGGGAMWAIAPPHRRKSARKTFMNENENKSSDRKLSLITFVSAACCVE